MTDKEKFEGLYTEVASMLVDFRDDKNRDHGDYLLQKWDDIRSKYDGKDDRYLKFKGVFLND